MSYELYNMVEPIMSASLNILTEAGVTAIYKQAGTGSLETPRVEIQVSIGAPVGHVHITSPSSSVFDSFEGSIRAKIVTNRIHNPTSHTIYVSKTLNGLSNPANFIGRLENYDILRVKSSGPSPTVDNDKTLDVSTLNFDFLVHIRADAW